MLTHHDIMLIALLVACFFSLCIGACFGVFLTLKNYGPICKDISECDEYKELMAAKQSMEETKEETNKPEKYLDIDGVEFPHNGRAHYHFEISAN